MCSTVKVTIVINYLCFKELHATKTLNKLQILNRKKKWKR